LKAKRVANSIIGMQIQTLVYRIRSKMIQIETRKRAAAAV
jgi:hypothetical protein